MLLPQPHTSCRTPQAPKQSMRADQSPSCWGPQGCYCCDRAGLLDARAGGPPEDLDGAQSWPSFRSRRFAPALWPSWPAALLPLVQA